MKLKTQLSLQNEVKTKLTLQSEVKNAKLLLQKCENKMLLNYIKSSNIHRVHYTSTQGIFTYISNITNCILHNIVQFINNPKNKQYRICPRILDEYLFK